MFTTLRSRLWLTYILVAGVAIGVVTLFFVLYLVRNPGAMRQAVARFSLAEETILNQVETIEGIGIDGIQQAAIREDRVLGVRILVLDADGNALVDSRRDSAALFPGLRPSSRITAQNATPPPILRDTRGEFWWYSLRQMGTGRYLMIAMPRPRIALRALLSDDLFRIILQAGGLAIFLALIVGLLMERWISSPLRRITQGATEIVHGKHQPIPLEGPQEVQDLARAFNELAHQVQVSQRSQRDFVANVSHELKTPLTSIQGFAQAILDGAASQPDTLHQAAHVIYDEASRMYRLVLDLLDLARLEAGTADLSRGSVDLPALLKSITEKLSPQAEKSQVSLQLELDALPPLEGDGDRLAQVFTNLVDNALKYSPTGGSVRISAGVKSNWIEVRIKDAGPGIPPEMKERVFERFFQVDPARKGGSSRGTGLGLAIAKEIVIAHRGSIGVDSQPGKGSIFWVKLPAFKSDITTLAVQRGKVEL
ncbi:MAG TPA: HAMP domain-containing sensor histidine kinase [Anaerolineaceae bacterium]|nr:HAMP domain-containing sensor histidine kinase [Anaerolineaceae bacterium]